MSWLTCLRNSAAPRVFYEDSPEEKEYLSVLTSGGPINIVNV